MDWYRFDIADAVILGGDFHRLCRQFQHAFIAAGAPAEMALFANRGLFDEARRVYVSPASTSHIGALIDAYGGVPCQAPDPGEVTMVYGVPGAKTNLLRSPVHEPAGEDAALIRPFVPMRQAAAGASG